MKMNLKAAAVATIASAVLVAGPVLAANEGQIEGGNIYRVKNVTKNINFTDPVGADACNVLQYKVRIHNPGPGVLSAVNVKATLPSNVATSNTSTILVSSQNADPASTSDTAVVNLSSAQSISYVSGSTQLLDASGSVMSTLADGITAGGVNINTVGVSIEQKRFVQFQAKVNCPETPTPTPNPSPLPQTGAEAGLAGLAGSGALGYAVVSYRRSRKALADAILNRK